MKKKDNIDIYELRYTYDIPQDILRLCLKLSFCCLTVFFVAFKYYF